MSPMWPVALDPRIFHLVDLRENLFKAEAVEQTLLSMCNSTTTFRSKEDPIRFLKIRSEVAWLVERLEDRVGEDTEQLKGY